MSANGSVDPGRVAEVARSALAALEASRRRLDDLNVYPVADGDTGTNMTLTARAVVEALDGARGQRDRKSTLLNSSHVRISYAVFCLKKKKNYIASYVYTKRRLIILEVYTRQRSV